MAKINTRENFRVEVRPRNPGDLGMARISGFHLTEDEAERACDEIASEVRRHVDGLPTHGDRGVTVNWDSVARCSHCGAVWTEDTDAHNGGCCSADAEAMDEAEARRG
jgi:hypothetical protein